MDAKARLSSAYLYGVTDLTSDSEAILEKVRRACQGGADIIQLRSKVLSDKAFYDLGLKLKRVIREFETLFFINDRVDLAVALEADGCHLGQDDLPLQAARELSRNAGRDLLFGLSTHSIAQARSALLEKPDYIGVGPVFSTPTKPDYQAVGLELVRAVSDFCDLPFFCIGGINLDNIETVRRAGGSRIAAVRALFGAEDPYEQARKFRHHFTQNT